MGQVVLLGDSIFDNARYVPDRLPVIDQVRSSLPWNWRATLLAVDGSITRDVPNQAGDRPADTTHLFVSAGGNDALGECSILNEAVGTVGEALSLVQALRMRFLEQYRAMLRALAAANLPTTVCTIYDAIPNLGQAERAALAIFNEVILREAFIAGIPVIDLRACCVINHPIIRTSLPSNLQPRWGDILRVSSRRSQEHTTSR